MTDETQRTLITAGTALLATIVTGTLTIGLQTWRDRAKEAREALVSYHLQRRTALQDVLSAVYQADIALGEAKAKWVLAADIDESVAGQLQTLSTLNELDVTPGSPKDLTIRRLHDRVTKDEARCAEANQASIQSSHEYVRAARSAIVAASLYRDYPLGLGSQRTLTQDLHAVFGDIPHAFLENIDVLRENLLATADDVSRLAAWELDATVAIRSKKPIPPFQALPEASSGELSSVNTKE